MVSYRKNFEQYTVELRANGLTNPRSIGVGALLAGALLARETPSLGLLELLDNSYLGFLPIFR